MFPDKLGMWVVEIAQDTPSGPKGLWYAEAVAFAMYSASGAAQRTVYLAFPGIAGSLGYHPEAQPGHRRIVNARFLGVK